MSTPKIDDKYACRHFFIRRLNQGLRFLFKEGNTYKFHYSIFLLISVVPFLWLREGVCISFFSWWGIFWEMKYPVITTVWVDLISAGNANSVNIAALPTSIYNEILGKIPLSASIKQATLFSSIVLFSLIFTYWLVMELFSHKELSDKRWIAFYSAIFYTLNFSVLFYLWWRFNYWLYSLPFVPLSLLLLIRGLKRSSFLYAFLFSLSVATFGILFICPAYLISVLFMGVLYLIIFHRPIKLNYIGLFIVILIFVNSSSLIPYAYFLQETYLKSTMSGVMGNFWAQTQVAQLPYVFTLTPTPTNVQWNERVNPWAAFYYTPYFTIISFLYPIVAFAWLLERKHKSNNERKVLFLFTFITLVGIFGAKGGNEPFGFINAFMMEKIPLMGIFRNVLDRFQASIVTGYSVIFGYSMHLIYGWLKAHRVLHKCVPIMLILLLFGVYAFPYWTGWIVTSPIIYRYDGSGNETELIASTFTRVPDYYFELKRYLQYEDPLITGRLLSLPIRPLEYTSFNWMFGYIGIDFMPEFFERSTFSYEAPLANWNNAMRLLTTSLIVESTREPTFFCKVAGLLNIRYAIIHHDIDIYHGHYGGQTLDSPEELADILGKNNFHYVKSFGQLDLYQIDSDYFLPRIYGVSNAIYLNGSLNEMTRLIRRSDFGIHDFIVLTSSQNSEQYVRGNSQIIVCCQFLTLENNGAEPCSFSYTTPKGREGKLFSLPKGGFIESIEIFSKNLDPVNNHTITAFISPAVGTPYVESYKLNVPANSSEEWRAISIARFWNYSELFISLSSSAERVKYGADIGSPYDYYVSNDEGASWSQDTWRLWIRVNYRLGEEPTLISDLSPSITYTRFDPTRYIAHIDASEPFFLVFSDHFHKDWHAYIDGSQVPEERHFVANGYANAWYIDKVGSFDVLIEFWPQRFVYYGAVVSFISLVSSVIYLTKGRIVVIYRYARRQRL